MLDKTSFICYTYFSEGVEVMNETGIKGERTFKPFYTKEQLVRQARRKQQARKLTSKRS